MSLKTLAGFYDDDWIRKLKDSITPQNYAIFDEIERLKKMHDYGGFSNHIEELLRNSREHDEMIKRYAQPLSDSVQSLIASLRMPVSDFVALEQRSASYSAIHSANAAIADIIDQRTNIEKIADQTATEISAITSAFKNSDIPDIARLNQYSAIGEISLAAQTMMADVNFADIRSAYAISSKHLSALESSFRGFMESYSNLYSSIQVSKVDIISLDWFVTELPPIEIYTGAGLARVISRPVPSEVEPAFPFEQDFVADIEGSLEEMLGKTDPSLVKMWRGAKFALKSSNPDRFRHVTVSLRELITQVLHGIAPDEAVFMWTSDPNHFHNGRPTRAARLLFACRNVNNGPFVSFVKNDVKSHLSFIDVFQAGTHNPDSSFTEEQMEVLIVRTETLLRFLLVLSTKN